MKTGMTSHKTHFHQLAVQDPRPGIYKVLQLDHHLLGVEKELGNWSLRQNSRIRVGSLPRLGVTIICGLVFDVTWKFNCASLDLKSWTESSDLRTK